MKTAQVIGLLKTRLGVFDLESLCRAGCTSHKDHFQDSFYYFQDGSCCHFLNVSWAEDGRTMIIHEDKPE